MAAKKKKKKATHYHGRPLSERTKFVISLPRSVPINEVIERGRAAGLDISKGLAHSIRQKHKDKIGDSVANGVAAPAKTVSAGARALSDSEQDLLGLVLNIGYTRSAELLASFRVQYIDTLKKG